jgi:hypothetical protein
VSNGVAADVSFHQLMFANFTNTKSEKKSFANSFDDRLVAEDDRGGALVGPRDAAIDHTNRQSISNDLDTDLTRQDKDHDPTVTKEDISCPIADGCHCFE